MTLHTDTARLILRKVAADNGWVRHGQGSTWDRDIYVRDEAMVNLRFGTRGALTFGERHGAGVSDVTGTCGKRETVIGWLTTDTDAAVPVVQAGTESSAADTLGQAVEQARAGAEKAAGAFGLLESELKTEREMHRVEVMRLIERAEAAEIANDQLEMKLATSEDRAAGWNAQAADLGEQLAKLRELVITLRTDYRQARERITELEDRLARVDTFRARLAGLDSSSQRAGDVADALGKILDKTGE